MRKFNVDWQKGYEEGLKVGIENENNRIIKLLEDSCTCIEECYCTFIKAIALIKGEQKVIHAHEIEVFGAPCDCGTRHEYCGECSWVEPCEPEGEQK